MTEYHPSIHTIIFISLFLIVYIILLLKNTIKNDIDFYDLLLLSSVAILPSIFVFFPKFVVWLAKLVGVEFPFLLLFGFLFLLVFIYLYRLVIKINQHHHQNILLIQELSLLRQELFKRKEDKTRQEKEGMVNKDR